MIKLIFSFAAAALLLIYSSDAFAAGPRHSSSTRDRAAITAKSKSLPPARVARTVRAAKGQRIKARRSVKAAPSKKARARVARARKAAPAAPVVAKVRAPRIIRPFTGKVEAKYSPSGLPLIADYQAVADAGARGAALHDQRGNTISLTLHRALQERAVELLEENRVPWGAIVALEPSSGRVLAFAGYSDADPDSGDMAVRAGLPAASLFKVVTAAAAVEQTGMSADTPIRFRGGVYTLNMSNYLPDARRDRNSIALATALGKSCNPAFGRIALKTLSPSVLTRYAESFLFNRTIPFEVPLGRSTFATPQTDYELARTGAGFGDALLSPVHAAMIAAAMANNGVMMQPYVVDAVVSPAGEVKYRGHPRILQRAVLRSTADKVLEMMHATVSEGTARKHFVRSRSAQLRSVRVAGKTGTLRGSNPQGVYHWFIGAAPMDNPQIAVAALVVDPGYARIGGTGLGVRLMETFFMMSPPPRQFVRRGGEYGPG